MLKIIITFDFAINYSLSRLYIDCNAPKPQSTLDDRTGLDLFLTAATMCHQLKDIYSPIREILQPPFVAGATPPEFKGRKGSSIVFTQAI